MTLRRKSPRPKSGELRLNVHGTILEGKSIGLNPKSIILKRLKKEELMI
jgi:hypothetical protein